MTVISLSIGQGELGCTPLQMANLAAILANRGYYYTPHIVRHIDGRDSVDSRFYDRHYTKVESRHFDHIVKGMYDAVHADGGRAVVPTSRGWTSAARRGRPRIPTAKTTRRSSASLPWTIPE